MVEKPLTPCHGYTSHACFAGLRLIYPDRLHTPSPFSLPAPPSTMTVAGHWFGEHSTHDLRRLHHACGWDCLPCPGGAVQTVCLPLMVWLDILARLLRHHPHTPTTTYPLHTFSTSLPLLQDHGLPTSTNSIRLFFTGRKNKPGGPLLHSWTLEVSPISACRVYPPLSGPRTGYWFARTRTRILRFHRAGTHTAHTCSTHHTTFTTVK